MTVSQFGVKQNEEIPPAGRNDSYHMLKGDGMAIPRAHPKKIGHNAKMIGRILAREIEVKCFGNTGKARRNCVNF